MTMIWVEPAGQATFGNQWWDSVTANVAIEFTIKKYGVSSTFHGNAGDRCAKADVCADAGRRFVVWFYMANLPADIYIPFRIANGPLGDIILGVVVNTSGVLSVIRDGGTLGTGTTLSTGTHYRLSFSYVVNSVSSWAAKLWLNGVSDIDVDSAGEGNLDFTGSNNLSTYGGSTGNMYTSPYYIDDGTDLGDPGDIRTTAKQYNSNSTNQFNIPVGANPANRWENVSERPLSETNGWLNTVASVNQEVYGTQSAAQGDIDISGMTLVGYQTWLWAKGDPATGADMILDGAVSPISLTASASLHLNPGTTPTYPTGVFGMQTDGNTDDVYFYEGGWLAVYLHSETPAEDVILMGDGLTD